MNSKKSKPVLVKIPQNDAKRAEGLFVYVTDANGKLIESAAIKNGDAALASGASALHGNASLFIGPAIPEELSKIPVTASLLQKGKAWQPSFRVNAKNVIELPFLPTISVNFPWRWCDISGTVTKNFIVSGTSEVLPVCHARVRIFEVEPLWIIWEKIPTRVFINLQQLLKKFVPNNPVTGVIPIPPDPGPETLLRSQGVPALPSQVRESILSPDLEIFKATLLKNFKFIHPYLCLWPWLRPWFYRFVEVGCTTTDCNGRFDYNLLIFPLSGLPNIYIEVDVFIGGQWVNVSRPWVFCNIYWDFACGTPVQINITDDRVSPCDCDPIEGAYVYMQSVNTGTSMRSVQQLAGASGNQPNAIGLTAYGSMGNISPFGGPFPLVVKFGSDLPGAVYNGQTVTHYRWSYRQLADPYLKVLNPADTPHNMTGAISRPYYYDIVTGSGTTLGQSAFTLGPVFDGAGNSIYLIPAAEASVNLPGVLNPDWKYAYVASIDIVPTNFADGLYEFTFELVDANGAVVPIPASNNPFLIDPIPYAPIAVSADGLPEGYVAHDGAGNVIAFNLTLRIDNTHCYSGISDAIVAGNTTDTECGTGYYTNEFTDDVELIFQAGHPHNFATYNFTVEKGNSGYIAEAGSSGASANENNALLVTSGDNSYSISQVTIISAPPPAPQNPENAVADMDQYEKSVLVADMLGDCVIAAFAENLYVSATHTNGNDRLSAYDAQSVAAIALAPKADKPVS